MIERWPASRNGFTELTTYTPRASLASRSSRRQASKSPRTAVGHYATIARNIPVECAGVTVRPGDIIVGDEDGVVVVPQERAAAVLKRALAIDQQEN